MKTDRTYGTKLLTATVLLPMAALAVTVEPLPPSGYADTEVSTNVHYEVTLTNVTRMAFVIALEATPTNNVEVAIGTDANGDGNLSVEEEAYAFGYDCGTWFCRARNENKVETAAVGPSLQPQTRQSHTFILKRRKLDTAWDTVKVTRRGFGDVGELVTAEGRYPGFKLEVR